MDAGLGHRCQHALEHVVGGHALAERVVGEDETVAQHVGGEVTDVVRLDVRTPTEQRQHPRGLDEPDRPARARAELDQSGDVAEPIVRWVAGGVGERDRGLRARSFGVTSTREDGGRWRGSCQEAMA